MLFVGQDVLDNLFVKRARKYAVGAWKVKELLGVVGRLDAALLFIDSYAGEISNLLAQTSKHIENGAFASIGIAE